MQELVDRLVSRTGVTAPMARVAVGIIFDFLRKEAPADKMQVLLDKVPGAADLAAEQSSGQAGAFGTGGIMGAANRLMSVGLSMQQVQSVAREVLAYAREQAGKDAVGDVVGAIPGLGQFV